MIGVLFFSLCLSVLGEACNNKGEAFTVQLYRFLTYLIVLAEYEQLHRSITMSGVIHAMKAADVRGGTYRMQ